MIEELASRVFAARDIAHREHWKTKSYAAHVALGAFYDGVIESIDDIVEAYQGLYGDIEDFECKTRKIDDVASFLQGELDWIEENRAEICQGSDTIGNLIDGLAGIYAKTVFLLGLK